MAWASASTQKTARRSSMPVVPGRSCPALILTSCSALSTADCAPPNGLAEATGEGAAVRRLRLSSGVALVGRARLLTRGRRGGSAPKDRRRLPGDRADLALGRKAARRRDLSFGRRLVIFWRLRWWWDRHTFRCWGCGRWERIFGRPVGDHRSCPPF